MTSVRSAWLGPSVLVIAALLVVGFLYVWERSSAPESMVDAYATVDPSHSYTNSTYGYSLLYPAGYESKEFQPMYAAIGHTQNGTFVDSADIATLYATVQDPIPTFADFQKLSSQLACGTSGTSPISCVSVATSSPFTTDSGISGTELYFSSNVGVRGPYFAFNITKNVPNASYAVLLIYPPARLASANADRALLSAIAASVRIAFK